MCDTQMDVNKIKAVARQRQHLIDYGLELNATAGVRLRALNHIGTEINSVELVLLRVRL